MSRYRLSADIGGTFTDLVLFDQKDNKQETMKVPTTPHSLSDSVFDGIAGLISDFNEVDFFVHGTTVGLNAFLERKGANVALIVTSGFKDIYEIGRANRPEIYNIQYRQPTTLIKRRNVYEIEERILVDGEVDTPLNEQSLQMLIKELSEADYDSVAVCLLHSIKNPKHEEIIKREIKKQLPEISVSLSHEVVREWREYERTSTSIINAYIAPIVENYLTKFEVEINRNKMDRELYIMQSNGGVMTSEIAKTKPIQTLLSGPVGGTMGSLALGERFNKENLICVDMGGTSFDVSMIIDGEPDITSEGNIETFPILSPMVNMHTIGAGGGSIAWIESGGLRVGPRSAGANPGPACYGNGGKHATVTDANLVLGRIDADGFLGGKMKLDWQAAYDVIENIANQLNLSVIETAEGICDIANAKMADAIRTLTVSKGIDPRDFSLVAFGGAGPMHAMFIAEHLNIKEVLIPVSAGTFSAWGMLQTDIRHDDVRNYVVKLNESNHALMEDIYKEMEDNAKVVLTKQNIKESAINYARLLDLRYVGQEYTVTVPLIEKIINTDTLLQLSEQFHISHRNIYGHHNPDGAIEIVNLRSVSTGLLDKEFHIENVVKNTELPNILRENQIVWKNKKVKTPVYSTADLAYGQVVNGPTIIESPTSTIVVPEHYVVHVRQSNDLEVIREELK